jgi:hypothetical protein
MENVRSKTKKKKRGQEKKQVCTGYLVPDNVGDCGGTMHVGSHGNPTTQSKTMNQTNPQRTLGQQSEGVGVKIYKNKIHKRRRETNEEGVPRKRLKTEGLEKRKKHKHGKGENRCQSSKHKVASHGASDYQDVAHQVESVSQSNNTRSEKIVEDERRKKTRKKHIENIDNICDGSMVMVRDTSALENVERPDTSNTDMENMEHYQGTQNKKNKKHKNKDQTSEKYVVREQLIVETPDTSTTGIENDQGKKKKKHKNKDKRSERCMVTNTCVMKQCQLNRGTSESEQVPLKKDKHKIKKKDKERPNTFAGEDLEGVLCDRGDGHVTTDHVDGMKSAHKLQVRLLHTLIRSP